MGAYELEQEDLTARDITLLLADAADGVEVGAAPVHTVLRGGRRRRIRRWATVTASTLVLVGSTAFLAVIAPDGDGASRGAPPAATQASAVEKRNPDAPRRTVLAGGEFRGERWQVFLDVWDAPRDETEARDLLAAMATRGESPATDRPAELIGTTPYFVRYTLGDTGGVAMQDVFTKDSVLRGTDLLGGSFEIRGPGSSEGSGSPDGPGDADGPGATGGPLRLFVGHVAKTAQRVTCTWVDDTTTVVHRGTGQRDPAPGQATILPAAGSPADWFVCVVPTRTASRSVEVTG